MGTAELLQPILTAGIRTTHFFNGRVLTAEDLRREQEASRARDALLGTAVGDGVVSGLEVTIASDPSGAPALAGDPASTLVQVTRGFALARTGDPIHLAADTTVRLVPAAEAARADAGLFAQCGLPSATLTNPGLYVLAIQAASGFDGSAPQVSMQGNGLATRCVKGMAVAGASLRLAPLLLDEAGTGTAAASVAQLAAQVEARLAQLSSATGTSRAALEVQLDRELSRLRNMAAHLCLGSAHSVSVAASPFADERGDAPTLQHGAVDAMRQAKLLSDGEVPIALLGWTRRGVEFVDWWAVRRPVLPAAVTRAWAPFASPRRAVEGMAAMWQFQQHIDDLLQSSRSGSTLAAMVARDWFRWLPPAGFVPIRGSGVTRAFEAAAFFNGMAELPTSQVNGAWLASLVREAALLPPIDLDARPPVQVYRARENFPAASGGNASPPYVAFATRDTHGPLELDAVTRAFQQAWEAYRGLVKRRVFLPVANTPDASGARVAIVAAIGDVTAVSLQMATLSASRSLASPDAIGAFAAMRDIQRELTSLFRSDIPGFLSSQTQDRVAFATTIDTYITTGIPGGGLGLAPAVQQHNLQAAARAQLVIDQFVAGWSGQGIATGFVKVDGAGSPRGTNVVPSEDNPYPHFFTVANRTDRAMTFAVAADVVGAQGDWSGALQVMNSEGGVIESLALAVNQTRQVTVHVRAPQNAVIGDTPILTLTVTAPQPSPQTDVARVPLTVAAAPGAPVTHLVEITLIPPSGINLDDLPVPGTTPLILNFLADVRYTSQDPSSERETLTVRAVIDQPIGAAPDWPVFFGSSPRSIESRADVGGVSRIAYTTPVTLSSGQTQRVTVQVRAPSARNPANGADKIATFTVEAVSTSLAPQARGASNPLTLRLRHS